MTTKPARALPRSVNQSGFTLLEVLIALLVLAVGLLGLAALQTTGLRSNTMATTRTHATQLASDISDRMRANVAGSYTTDSTNTVTAIVDDYGMASCPNPLPSPLPGPPSSPDPSAMATYDLDTWCDSLMKTLPSGDATIAQVRQDGLDATPNTLDDVVTYDVTVYWDEERTGATGKGCDPLKKTDLRCIQLNVTIPRPIPNG